MANNYKNILTVGSQSSLATTPIVDGSLRFTSDSGELFMDMKSERVKISDIVSGMTEAEIKAQLAPLPKIYLSKDTNRLLVHGSEWVDVSMINLSATAGKSDVVWLSSKNANTPKYDETFGFDASTKTVKSNKFDVRESMTIGKMQITSTSNADDSVDIDFELL